MFTVYRSSFYPAVTQSCSSRVSQPDNTGPSVGSQRKEDRICRPCKTGHQTAVVSFFLPCVCCGQAFRHCLVCWQSEKGRQNLQTLQDRSSDCSSVILSALRPSRRMCLLWPSLQALPRLSAACARKTCRMGRQICRPCRMGRQICRPCRLGRQICRPCRMGRQICRPCRMGRQICRPCRMGRQTAAVLLFLPRGHLAVCTLNQNQNQNQNEI